MDAECENNPVVEACLLVTLTCTNQAAGLPPEMLAALKVADEPGNCGDTLEKLADLYDDGF